MSKPVNESEKRMQNEPEAGLGVGNEEATHSAQRLSRRRLLATMGGIGAVVASGGLLMHNVGTKAAMSGDIVGLDSVADIQNLNLASFEDGQHFSIQSYHPDTSIGGGLFYMDKSCAKSEHNGGTVISTTVPWDGTIVGLAGFLDRVGETDPSGNGCLVRLYGDWITPQMFGAQADGTADTTKAIQKTIDQGRAVYFPSGTYLLRLSQSISLAGGATVCSIIARDRMTLVGAGIGKTILKLKDNESTDASPKYFNIIAGNTEINNMYVEGITFDVNGDNNKISPNRGSGSYNNFNCAGIFISGTVATSGADARLYHSKITNCEFINSPGVTCIATGQQEAYGLMSNNVEISFCRFYNNGTDSSDHSAVYMWGDHIHVHHCVFDHPTVSTAFPGPVVAAELHGSGNFFTNDIVNNYAQGLWISGNQTTPSRGIHVTGNSFNVSWFGVGLFSITPIDLGISDVVIANNRIHIIPGAVLNPGMSFPKTAIFLAMQNGPGDRMTVTGNQLYCTDRSSNLAILVSAAAGSHLMDTMVSDNLINGFSRGICVGFGTTGSVFNTTIKSNVICNLQPTTSLPGQTQGIQVSGTHGGLTIVSNEIGGGTGVTHQGVFLGITGAGDPSTLDYLHMEGNRIDAAATEPIHDDIYVTGRRSGEQATTFNTIPSQAAWKVGDVAIHANPVEEGVSPNKYMVVGWQRITNGTGNVLNTDWLERRAMTGR